MVACEECIWPQVTGLRWYRWLELRSRWRRQQYSHFDTACQRPKGKSYFLFVVMMSMVHVISAICRTLFPPSAGDEYKNHPSCHGSIALPVPEVPKMSVGAICSPPPVAMAVVGWFLCFPAFFFFKMGFFPHTRLTPKIEVYMTYTKKKIPWKKKCNLRQKKKVTRLTPKKNIKGTYAYFHNRATLSSWARVLRTFGFSATVA